MFFWQAHAKAAIEKLVGGTVDHHHVSSELSDVFLSALQHLPNEYPGVKEQREKIQVFFTDHRKQVGANDLLKLMAASEQGGGVVDMPRVSKCFGQLGDEVASIKEVQENLDSFLARCINQLFAKASLWPRTN